MAKHGTSLINLRRSIELEKKLSQELQKLRGRMMEIEELRREVFGTKFYNVGKYNVDDEINEEIVKCLRKDNYSKIHELLIKRSKIRKWKKNFTMKFINRHQIHIFNSQGLEAVIFLKRNGWKGCTLIMLEDDFAIQFSGNNVPFLFIESYFH